MLRLFSILCLSLMVSVPALADDSYGSMKDDGPDVAWELEEAPETDAHGCYYMRGRRYCARYCYWEVNGKRYCRERLRGAHSQWYYPLSEEARAPERHYRRFRRQMR